MDISFRFFWPPFNPWEFLFNSFGHRLIRGRYFSFLLATARSVAVAFQFFWPRHCFVTVYSRNIASSVFFHKNFDFILFLKQKDFEYSYSKSFFWRKYSFHPIDWLSFCRKFFFIFRLNISFKVTMMQV